MSSLVFHSCYHSHSPIVLTILLKQLIKYASTSLSIAIVLIHITILSCLDFFNKYLSFILFSVQIFCVCTFHVVFLKNLHITWLPLLKIKPSSGNLKFSLTHYSDLQSSAWLSLWPNLWNYFLPVFPKFIVQSRKTKHTHTYTMFSFCFQHISLAHISGLSQLQLL